MNMKVFEKLVFGPKSDPKGCLRSFGGLQNASFGIPNHCFYYKMSTRNPCIFTWFLKRSLSRSALFTYIWNALNRNTTFLHGRRREPREIHAFLHGFRRAQNCILAFNRGFWIAKNMNLLFYEHFGMSENTTHRVLRMFSLPKFTIYAFLRVAEGPPFQEST